MPRFEYPCPDCRTRSNLHAPDCEFEGTNRSDIEKAYTDILAVLSAGTASEGELQSEVHGRWSPLHEAALSRLRYERRVEQGGEDGERGNGGERGDRGEDKGRLELLTVERYKEEVTEPTREPLQTIYREGSVPGAHDNSVFALVAWYEMVGLSWEETRERVVRWLRESGTWDRGGFEESTPAELVDSKRHVYEEGYGWKEKARAAKAVIDRSSASGGGN